MLLRITAFSMFYIVKDQHNKAELPFCALECFLQMVVLTGDKP